MRSSTARLRPRLIVVAGANGAGKSTAAPSMLRDRLGVTDFVNADTIAQGLSVFSPETVGPQAGRIMLTRLSALADRRANFAFETTLASRTFAPWIARLKAQGYAFHLVFLSVRSPDLAVARVVERVRLGGHDVPEEVIRRRHERGMTNFFELYRVLATSYRLYDTSSAGAPRLVESITPLDVELADPIDRAFEEGTPIDEAVAEGVREALKRHKQAGNPICEWQDGKVVWIPPEEIEIDDEPPPKR